MYSAPTLRTFLLPLILLTMLISALLQAAPVQNLDTLTRTHRLIEHLSRERGMSIMLIARYSEGTARSLSSQRRLVDDAANACGDAATAETLKSLRRRVDARDAGSGSGFDALVNRLLEGVNTAYGGGRYGTYTAFLTSRAAVEQLRDAVTPYLIAGRPLDAKTQQTLQTLSRKTGTPDYSRLNDRRLKARLDDIFANEDSQELGEDVTAELNNVRTGAASGRYPVTFEVFFVTLSERSNELDRALQAILESLR